MTYLNYTLLLLLFCVSCSPTPVHHQNFLENKPTENSEQAVNYDGFLELTKELQDYRKDRLVDITTFAKMLEEEDVLLLDTRSARAYRAIHIEGAVHLNFSDFTTPKLAEVIPSKDTKILIYCNNNFLEAGPDLYSKSAPLALNVPTFINLYGYGYKNIYELDGSITLEAAREHLNFVDINTTLQVIQREDLGQE